jgi:hypothetical protein
MAWEGNKGTTAVLAGSAAIALSAAISISVTTEAFANVATGQNVRERLSFFHNAVKAGDIVPLTKDGKKLGVITVAQTFSQTWGDQSFSKAQCTDKVC